MELPSLSFEELMGIDPTNVDDLTQLLLLPEDRAERTAELAEQFDQGELGPLGFLALAMNLIVRKEQIANDKVTQFGIKPMFGLDHLHPQDGKTGPSLNNLIRGEYDEINSKQDVIDLADEAEEEGILFRTKNIVYFHPADVDVTEDGFEPNPQIRGETEQETTDDEPEVEVDAQSAVGL